MSTNLLDSTSPEAVALVESLGLSALRISSLEFKLNAGELALVTVRHYVEVDDVERFAEFFRQFNLVPKEMPE